MLVKLRDPGILLAVWIVASGWWVIGVGVVTRPDKLIEAYWSYRNLYAEPNWHERIREFQPGQPTRTSTFRLPDGRSFQVSHPADAGPAEIHAILVREGIERQERAAGILIAAVVTGAVPPFGTLAMGAVVVLMLRRRSATARRDAG
jgi:hypothetical protein